MGRNETGQRLRDAGLEYKAYGEIDRPLAAVRWDIPPEIALDVNNSLIVYKWGAGPERLCSPEKGLLQQFIALDETKPEKILAYAKRWGVLRIQREGSRLDRHPSRSLATEERQKTARAWQVEEIADWQTCIRKARALVNLAVNLRGRKRGENIHWATLDEPPLPWTHGKESEVFTGHLDAWLKQAEVRFKCYWPDGAEPYLGLQTYGIFGALGLELASTITKGKGIAICSGCSKVYTPSKWPTPGTKTFCKECGPLVSNMLAKREKRAKEKATDDALCIIEHS